MRLATKRNRSAAALNLYEYVYYFSAQHCKDPRDKVYGLLGLVKDNEKPEVDYGKTVQEVLLDVLRADDSLARLAEHVLAIRLQTVLGQQEHGTAETSVRH